MRTSKSVKKAPKDVAWDVAFDVPLGRHMQPMLPFHQEDKIMIVLDKMGVKQPHKFRLKIGSPLQST